MKKNFRSKTRKKSRPQKDKTRKNNSISEASGFFGYQDNLTRKVGEIKTLNTQWQFMFIVIMGAHKFKQNKGISREQNWNIDISIYGG